MKMTPMQRARRYRKWYLLPKTLDETGLAILRQQEREARDRKKARLASLKKT